MNLLRSSLLAILLSCSIVINNKSKAFSISENQALWASNITGIAVGTGVAYGVFHYLQEQDQAQQLSPTTLYEDDSEENSVSENRNLETDTIKPIDNPSKNHLIALGLGFASGVISSFVTYKLLNHFLVSHVDGMVNTFKKILRARGRTEEEIEKVASTAGRMLKEVEREAPVGIQTYAQIFKALEVSIQNGSAIYEESKKVTPKDDANLPPDLVAKIKDISNNPDLEIIFDDLIRGPHTTFADLDAKKLAATYNITEDGAQNAIDYLNDLLSIPQRRSFEKAFEDYPTRAGGNARKKVRTDTGKHDMIANSMRRLKDRANA